MLSACWGFVTGVSPCDRFQGNRADWLGQHYDVITPLPRGVGPLTKDSECVL